MINILIFMMTCGKPVGAVGVYEGQGFTIPGQDAKVLMEVIKSEKKLIYEVELTEFIGGFCA